MIGQKLKMAAMSTRQAQGAIQLPARYIKEAWGRVHSIDTFSAIDGDGIRYMLFLQGCNLRCKSCSNPDTWNFKTGTDMSTKQIMRNIDKYKNYIDGITVSGGEPLLQPKFVSTLFEECHDMGLTTCIDTAGQSLQKNWLAVLPHTDLVLFCLKHIDPLKYQKFTGFPQSTALKFLDTMEKMGVPYQLRYLYVPGFSDDMGDIDRFVNMVKELKYIKCVEFLPYHRLGVNKWDALGFTYPLKDVPIPTKEKVNDIRSYIESAGIKVL